MNTMGNYLAYIIMGFLIAAGALVTKAAYGQEWYLGEGVQQGLLVKYEIKSFDLNRGDEFEATLWFGSQDDKENWITDVIIEDNGNVITGKLKLSSLSLTPLGTDISEELKPYRAAIKESLGWLGGYADKLEPESLSGGKAWGVVAAIGGGGIIVAPTGTETIQAAGQSWDTSIIGFHYAVDSKIWVKDGFPLPIKAKVYTISSQQPIPEQFSFELLETRISETAPVPPEATLQLPQPPLSKQTASGAYNIDLYWQPVTIEPGKTTTIGVVIFDQQQKLLRQVQYDLLITDADGKVIKKIDAFTASEGQGTHEVTFESAGKSTVTVTVLGTLTTGLPGKLIEKADFTLIVVPEFPIGIAIVMAAIVAMMIAITKFKKISIRPVL